MTPNERRKSSRRLSAEPIRIRAEGIFDFTGRLSDISEGGFSVHHDCREITSGQQVEFEHAGGRGTAVVIWDRIAGGRVQSGFRILTD